MNRIEIQIPATANAFEELRHLNLTMACTIPNKNDGWKSLIIIADDEALVYLKLKYPDFKKTIMEIF